MRHWFTHLLSHLSHKFAPQHLLPPNHINRCHFKRAPVSKKNWASRITAAGRGAEGLATRSVQQHALGWRQGLLLVCVASYASVHARGSGGKIVHLSRVLALLHTVLQPSSDIPEWVLGSLRYSHERRKTPPLAHCSSVPPSRRSQVQSWHPKWKVKF